MVEAELLRHPGVLEKAVFVGGLLRLVEDLRDVPARFADRLFYEHNPTVTLMRTTLEENRRLGEQIGDRAAAAVGPTTLMLPLDADWVREIENIRRKLQTERQ